MPFGEHQRDRLAVACELLGGALTGGGTWHAVNVHRRALRLQREQDGIEVDLQSWQEIILAAHKVDARF